MENLKLQIKKNVIDLLLSSSQVALLHNKPGAHFRLTFFGLQPDTPKPGAVWLTRKMHNIEHFIYIHNLEQHFTNIYHRV